VEHQTNETITCGLCMWKKLGDNEKLKVGQQVLYVPAVANGDIDSLYCERGWVSSFNRDEIPWVKYGGNNTAQLTYLDFIYVWVD